MTESPTNRTKLIFSLSPEGITPILTILEYASKFLLEQMLFIIKIRFIYTK